MSKGIQIGVNEIIEITYGVLLNQSSISYFYRICDDCQTVKRGDLFVAMSKDTKQAQQDIAMAVQRGAFGILFSGNVAISDLEVVWINVENIEQSLVRILRHYCIVGNKVLFLLNRDEYQIAMQVIVPKNNLEFYCGGIAGLINAVLESHANYFVYCDSHLNIEALPKGQQEIKILSQEKINEGSLPFIVSSYSLFNTKIFYQSEYYELTLPRIFVQLLARVLKFCEECSFKVQLDAFEGISNFKPLYLDEHGAIAKAGTTNKVLLACMDVKLYEQYLAYFTMNAKWAHLHLFVPAIYQEIYAPYAEVFGYASEEELFLQLIERRYNFALILGTSTHRLEERLTENKTEEKSLFEYLENPLE